MNDIVVTYPFCGFKRKVKAKVPAGLGELSAEQFVAVVRTINGAAANIGFMSQITGIGKRLLSKMHPYSLTKLAESVAFFDNAAQPHSDFIIRTLPTLRLGSPRPKLANMQFGQFIFADSYYNAWATSKNHTALYNFIATIYLPEGEIFNADTIEKRALQVSEIDIFTAEAIVFNWALIVLWLQKAYPLVFQEPATDSDPQKSKPAKNSQSSWLKLFDRLVGDNLPERDRWAALPVNAVFRHLSEKFKEQARQKA